MRSRNIKPGFFLNEDLVECSPLARLLFAGLWCAADRSGRLEHRPKRFKIELLPGDNVEVSALLSELAAHGLIRFYGEGDCYLWIPNFLKHQNPHRDEKKSVLPAHPEDATGSSDAKSVVESDTHGVGTVVDDVEHGACTVQAPCKDSSSPADSRFPIPDSGLLIADTRKPIPDGPRPAASSVGVGDGKRGASSPSSISAMLPQLEPETPIVAKQRLLSKIMSLGDGPEYDAWWKVVINRMEAADGLGVLLEAVEKAIGCGDPTVRARKDWGELSKPSAFVASLCGKHLKANGRSLPRAPGPTKVARVETAPRVNGRVSLAHKGVIDG